jgi:hypothetical protein
MKRYLAVGFTTTALASGFAALAAVANAAPTGPSQVDDTVRSLEAEGYNVVVNRTGAAPLSQCSVSAVRPGQTHSTTDSRGGSSLNTTVTSQTVYVDVAC